MFPLINKNTTRRFELLIDAIINEIAINLILSPWGPLISGVCPPGWQVPLVREGKVLFQDPSAEIFESY